VPSEADGRRRLLKLTATGEEAFSLLDRRSREEVAGMLNGLFEKDQQKLLGARPTIGQIPMNGGSPTEPLLLLR
jgi:DNA-binding MarR family transcriptional regulator